MSKMIIDVGGKEYKMELDRAEIIRAEKIGLNLNLIEKQPLTQTTLFWSIGLHKNHPNLSPEQALKLYDSYVEDGGDIQEVIGFLGEQYASFLLATPTSSGPSKKALRIE